MFTETVSDFAGRRIREERNRRRWKTSDLARRVAELGYSNPSEWAIKDIESGRHRDGVRSRRITLEELYACARALDCSPMALLPALDGKGGLSPVSEQTIEQALNAIQGWAAAIKSQQPGSGVA
jgi:hypothetical protein